jgi:putative transposase
MIVQMRTRAQAEKVAEATGGVQLSGKPKHDGTPTLSARVDVGADFESRRAAVEAVSALFTLYDTDPSTGELVEVPSGWVLQAYQYALDPTSAQVAALESHAGGARFAFNTMLAAVKSNLDQRKAERSYRIPDDQLTPVVSWSFQELRNRWNQIKHQVAVGDDGSPWWQDNSKEAYANAVANLAEALSNWDDSRTGERKGPKMGFPRFKHKGRAAKRFTFTTGTMRVEPSRHHVTLPVLGTIHTHESTRKLGRRLESGTAQILRATVRFQRGRWLVSFTCAVRRADGCQRAAGAPDAAAVVGIDAGVKDLLVVAGSDGIEIARHSAPRELKRALRKLRALQRKAARQRGPWNVAAQQKQDASRGWESTQAELARAHARVANLRADRIHKLTTSLATTHQVVGEETLAVKNMMRRPKPKPDPDNPGAFLPNGATAKTGLNRALADAGIGEMFRQLDYKTRWYGSHLVKADRWFPSSKMCFGCGAVKTKLHLAERVYHCEHCGLDIDRDRNAAINLARHALKTTEPSTGVVTGGADRKTEPSGTAGGCETGTVSERSARPKGRAA